MGAEALRVGFGRDLAVEEQERARAHAERLFDVMIGEHHADAFVVRERAEHVAEA